MIAAGLAVLAAACSPLGMDRAALEDLRAAAFALEAEQADGFLEGATGCAGERDPFFRDKVGYEGISAVLRGGGGSKETVRRLTLELIEELEKPNREVDRRYGERRGGLRASFLTLYLVEFARRDRIEPFLSEEERDRLVALAAAELREVTDYRGFDERDGWRHHVAHAADLALQLALNPAIDNENRLALAEALLSQVNPDAVHFYTYGEPGRLALPLLYLAMGSSWTDEEIAALITPLTAGPWDEPYGSQSSLARIHNVRNFLHSVIIRTEGQEQPQLAALRAAALEARTQLP